MVTVGVAEVNTIATDEPVFLRAAEGLGFGL